jgi:hypothetical protein
VTPVVACGPVGGRRAGVSARALGTRRLDANDRGAGARAARAG